MKHSVKDMIIKVVQNEVAANCLIDHCGIAEAWNKTIRGELLNSDMMHMAWMKAMYGSTENQFWTLYSGALQPILNSVMQEAKDKYDENLPYDPISGFLKVAIPHVVSLLENGKLQGYSKASKEVSDFFKANA